MRSSRLIHLLPSSHRLRCLLSAAFLAGGAFTGRAGPGQPEVIAPANAAASHVEHPDFLWTSADGAAGYEIQVAADADFRRPIVADRVEIARFVPLRPLPAGDVFWRVRAHAGDGAAGPWSETQTYQVRLPTRDFQIGAVADLPEIRRVLGAAVAAAPARVTFAAGATYRVKPDDAVLTLAKARDLIIEGNDALVIIENPSAGFIRMDACERITVRGFRVDYDPLPHTVGRVESVDLSDGAYAAIVRAEPGYPAFDAPHVRANSGWGVVLDPAPERRGWMKVGSPLVLRVDAKNTQRNDDGTFRLPMPARSQAATLVAGDRVIVFARTGGKGFASHNRCSDITYDHVTAHACPGGHFSYLGGTRLKILASGSRRRDETRWYAGNADGVHARANVIGPWIEGCTFEAIGDDAVALYNKGIVVTRQLSDHSVQVLREYLDLEAGESFRIFNPRDGALIGDRFTVTQIARSGADAVVDFTPALPAGVELTSDAAQKTRSDQLFPLARRNALFMVRGNQFTGIRRYGTVFRSPDGVVKHNRYRGVSNAAITSLNEPDFWHNGFASERIVIAGNTVEQSAFDGSSANVGSIHLILRKLGGGAALVRPFREITIAENTITDWSQRAISLQNAEDCAIVDNVIRSTLGDYPLAKGEHYGIYLNNVRTTRVRGNDLRSEHRPLTAAIAAAGGAADTVAVSENRMP